MKTVKLFLTVCLLAAVTSASAQFANGGGSKSSNFKNTDSYNRVWFGYQPMSMTYSYSGYSSSESLSAIAFGYTRGISVMETQPLFVEVGGNLGYGFKSINNASLNLVAVQVPVNLTYKFSFGNGDFSLAPYFGLNFRINLLGSISEGGESINIFDKDIMGNDAYKRFQMGWQIGVGLNYKRFYFGAGYGTDFMEICENTKIGTATIAVGINF